MFKSYDKLLFITTIFVDNSSSFLHIVFYMISLSVCCYLFSLNFKAEIKIIILFVRMKSKTRCIYISFAPIPGISISRTLIGRRVAGRRRFACELICWIWNADSRVVHMVAPAAYRASHLVSRIGGIPFASICITHIALRYTRRKCMRVHYSN